MAQQMTALNTGHIFAQRTFKHVTAMAHQRDFFIKRMTINLLNFLAVEQNLTLLRLIKAH